MPVAASLLDDLRSIYKLADIRYMPRDQKRRNIIWACLLGGSSVSLAIIYKGLERRYRNQKKDTIITTTKSGWSRQYVVDRVFLRHLWRILRIILPSIKTKEFLHLTILTFLLVARSIISVKLADITGKNAQYLVQQRWDHLVKGVLIFAAVGLPASFVNSGLEYEKNTLALRFRKRLSDYVNRAYLSGVNFYKAAHLSGLSNEPKLDNADQRITTDVEKFCDVISNVYASVFKPIIDIIILTIRLSSILGFRGPFILFGYYAYTSLLKRSFMPAFGKLAARESELEGDYRMAHQRLIVNAEEIAFCDGSMKERSIIMRLFNEIYSHSSYVQWIKLAVGVFDNYLIKYGTSIIGYAILGLPVYLSYKTSSVAQLTNNYVRNRQLLISLGAAVAQLVILSNRVTSLSGLTGRVGELLEMVQKLDSVGTKPFAISSEPDEAASDYTINPYFDSVKWLEEWRIKGEQIRLQREARRPALVRTSSSNEGGKIMEGKFVKFENVNIVSPAGKLLVDNLTFQVRIHENVMINGPNGSGKSSIFRILGELWPLYNGLLVKPTKEELLFIPQKPYLVLGTLRDQIIYPHSLEDMRNLGVTDEDLTRLLDIVDPVRRILSTWNWDHVRDWHDVLSGGQKQRMAMARLFYHRPLFAILDECTSMVSGEVESKIYDTCKALGITLFTVSHRTQLRKYHDKVLRLDGRGGYDLFQVDHTLDKQQEKEEDEEEEDHDDESDEDEK